LAIGRWWERSYRVMGFHWQVLVNLIRTWAVSRGLYDRL